MNRPGSSWKLSTFEHQTDVTFDISITFSHSDWQTSLEESHPFLHNVSTAVHKYRIQSPTRFRIPIEVGQVLSKHMTGIKNPNASFTLWVGFYNFGDKPIFAACRVKRRKPRRGIQLPSTEIEAYTKKLGKFVPLERLLKKHFPTFDNIPVGHDAMFQWWKVNGKVFRWLYLPNELKERIIYFCMDPSPLPSSYRGRIKGAPEVTSQFGKWAALLGVSHQVRALCLRMCFVGSKDLAYGRGLCINAKGHYALKGCMRRLGKCPQMLSPGDLPTNKTAHLAELYDAFPRIYPDLHRYATLRHGIRKINLQLPFLDAMHFFKVTTGSFAQYLGSYRLDYTIFERLPHLNELVILLPDATGFLTDSFRQDGPQLFYGEPFNCPRILHRIIYERAAEALAIHDNVKMYGFLDEAEAVAFYRLRKEARARLKFTMEELDELYSEDGGGVELDESVAVDVQDGAGEELVRDIIQDPFWPPKCRCKILCRQVLYPST